MSAPSGKSRHSIVQDEHLEIRSAVAKLRSTTDIRILAGVLSGLQEMLPAHFEREEGPDGLGAEITEQAPQSAFALEQIFGEHVVILEMVSALSTRSTGLLDGIAALARMLEQHEAKESKLFVDAIYTDLGEGD